MSAGPSAAPARGRPRTWMFAGIAALATAAQSAPLVEPHDPRLLVEAPSEAVVGEPVSYSVLLQEEWGREGPWVPTAGVERSVRLEVATTDSLATLDPRPVLPRENRGRHRADVVFRTPGLHRILVDAEAGVSGESNPIRVLPEAPTERVYWGDLHGHLHTPGAGHSGRLDLDEYAKRLQEGFAFARDVSLLDFAAVTEHIQTAGGLASRDASGRSPWDVILAAVEAVNAPGRFVTYPGFEWQGEAGDHCVLYPAPGPIDAPADFDALAASVRARGALLTAHAVFLPSKFEACADLAAIEVTRDSKSTEWLAKTAYAQGVVRPFLGCSDTHGGALGATSLTGLRAPSLDRASIFRGIREGRTWATNGERIVLDVRVDAAGELPHVVIHGVGTAPIDRIEIYRDGEICAEARGVAAQGLAFGFEWKDTDLLRPECLAGGVAYHVRVVQVSSNRYDPGERDVAISSPTRVALLPRHFDAAHVQRGGRRDAAPGAVLELVRTAWNALASAPDLPPEAAPLGGELPAWSANDVAALRQALRALDRLAAKDTVVASLQRALAPLPLVAAATQRLARLQHALSEARETTAPTAVRVSELRAELERTTAEAEVARARVEAAGRPALERAWFAPRMLETVPQALAVELERFAALPERPRRAAGGSEAPVSELTVPVDPRTAAEVGAVQSRAAEIDSLHERSWGYTSPTSATTPSPAALRVRVVAEGAPGSARLLGGGLREGEALPFEASGRGWVAMLDRYQVPVAGEPPLRIELSPETHVSGVFLERPRGAPLRTQGRVASWDVQPAGEVVRVRVQVDPGPVTAEILDGDRVLWSGALEAGSRALAFPAASCGDPAALRIRWGFAGWRRVAGTEVPGHDVAGPLGFGALADGRALIALEREVLAVSPESGAVTRMPLPDGLSLGTGREFCAAPCQHGTVIRGAGTTEGGWALLLTHENAWLPVERGPESATVVSDGQGGIAWLRGDQLHRRAADGTEAEPRRLDVSGRLLAIDANGRAVVRTAGGETVRADPSDGRLVERISAPLLGVDRAGAALTLEGLNRRHAELATGIRVMRHPGDGSKSVAFPVAIKTLPQGDVPVYSAAAPDGSLLLLGGTIGWRRGPEHDWWGASVERWAPVWAGECHADQVSSQ